MFGDAVDVGACSGQPMVLFGAFCARREPPALRERRRLLMPSLVSADLPPPVLGARVGLRGLARHFFLMTLGLFLSRMFCFFHDVLNFFFQRRGRNAFFTG